jgi:hypothetical protein
MEDLAAGSWERAADDVAQPLVCQRETFAFLSEEPSPDQLLDAGRRLRLAKTGGPRP